MSLYQFWISSITLSLLHTVRISRTRAHAGTAFWLSRNPCVSPFGNLTAFIDGARLPWWFLSELLWVLCRELIGQGTLFSRQCQLHLFGEHGDSVENGVVFEMYPNCIVCRFTATGAFDCFRVLLIAGKNYLVNEKETPKPSKKHNRRPKRIK